MSSPVPSPQERILHAALTLLETGGIDAVSTRAVSVAANVQPPTIYRHYGDMRGLLDAVASAGFHTYLRANASRARRADPVQELREGWHLHVDFGLKHPHLYALMYAAPESGTLSPAAREGFAALHALIERIAATGRLTTGVERAAAMVHRAGLGYTLGQLSDPIPDPSVSDAMLDAVLSVILTPEPADATPPGPSAAAHAVALAAVLKAEPSPFSEAERYLLTEWLRRLM